MKNKKPNILFITSDQHRADCMGHVGHPCVQTPHLDMLAYQGVSFQNAYSDCPVCIPARTTMITGIQSHVYGKPEYAEQYRIERDRKDFLGSLITGAGYHSQLVGKTHWHTPESFRAGFENVVWMANLRKQELVETGRSFNPTGIGFNELTPTLSKLPPHLHSTDWIVDRCLDFLETREQEQPFFLWASFQDPHPPLVIHEPYYSMYDDDEIPTPQLSDWSQSEECPYDHFTNQWMTKVSLMGDKQLRKARSAYYGMITNLDHQLGRLFGKIIQDGEWDNTYIIYVSDHGEMLGDHGLAKKNCFLEGSARIPFIVKPPKGLDVEPGRENNSLVELADILPTLCEAAGVKAPEDITGKSLAPLLDGSRDEIREEMHGQINNDHMYHDGRFKYLYYADDGKEMLFDTQNDPHDMNPLDDPDKSTGMRKRFMQHLEAEGNPQIEDGKLLNLKKEKPSVREARSRDGAGLSPTATLHSIMQDSLHIH